MEMHRKDTNKIDNGKHFRAFFNEMMSHVGKKL